MIRRSPIAPVGRVSCLLVVLFLNWFAAPIRAQDPPPNIITILADDMGWDIAALGHPHVKTPNLDRLVAEGRVFENFYVASPVCSPTRVSLLTGFMPSRFRIHDFISDAGTNRRRNMPNYLDQHVFTVADVAKQAGYRTGHYGKWHLRAGTTPAVSAYGFDENKISWTSDAQFRSYSSHDVIGEAIDFIERGEGQRFYLDIWLFQMHRPVVADGAQESLYDGETFPPTDFESYMVDYAASAVDAHDRSLEYNAVMTSLDAAVGTLLDYLELSGQADHTLLLFTSDNGPEDHRPDILNAPGMGSAGRYRGRKRSIYEGGIRMPCIARWPGVIPAGTVDTTSVISSADWLPTVATLVDEPIPPLLDGEDRLQALLGTPSSRTKPLLWDYRSDAVGEEFNAPQYAIRDGRWKLLWEEGMTNPELYDIVKDPEERSNLSLFVPAVVADLQQKIENFVEELTPAIPAILSEPPAVLESDPDGSISFTVVATGSPPPRYEWYRDGKILQDQPRFSGSKSPTLTIEELDLIDAGEYFCRVSNDHGVVFSTPLQFTVEVAPEILSQPVGALIWDGGLASYSVTVKASGPISYQWLLDGVALTDGPGIFGSQSSNLLVAGLSAPFVVSAEAGYSCFISNPVGTALSERAGMLVAASGSTTYETWANFFLGGASGAADPNGDCDEDGESNFLEFALATNAKDGTSLPRLEVGGDVLDPAVGIELSYLRWRGGTEQGFGTYETPELTYQFERYDGTSWAPSNVVLTLVRIEPSVEGTSERAVYRIQEAFSPPTAILRLRVTER